MNLINYLKIIIILIILETIIFVLFRGFYLIQYVPNGFGPLATLLYVIPPLAYTSILLQQKKIDYSYMKLALSFLFVLICSNILSLPILDYVFNRYMPFEIGLIIFISFMFAVPAFLSPLFSRFVKNKKDNNVLDN